MVNRRKSRSTEKSVSGSKSKHNSNAVRIIGGDWRGRKLVFPNIEGLRPTGDRMRETLFNWLAPYINGAQAVDLFAGSGALGFEALSRGASAVDFVEVNAQAATSIRQNLEMLNANSQQQSAIVQQKSAFDYIKDCNNNSCDLLFIDPPFSDNLHNQIFELIELQNLMKPNSWIYIEASENGALEIPKNWAIHREKVSGQVRYLLCNCQR